MLCIVEIACFIFGLIILISGKLPVSGGKECRGAPARIAGLFLMSVFPIALGIGIIVGFQMAQNGQQPGFNNLDPSVVFIDIGAIAFGIIPALIIGFATAKPIKRKKKRRRTDDYDDAQRDYDDRRPARGYDDEDDDRPRRRRAEYDDEDDDRRRRDEDDEDDRPRRKRYDD